MLRSGLLALALLLGGCPPIVTSNDDDAGDDDDSTADRDDSVADDDDSTVGDDDDATAPTGPSAEIVVPVPNSIFEETVSVLFSGEVSDPHLPARGPDGHLEFQHRRAGGAYRGPFCTQTRRESSRAPVRKSLG